MIQIGGVTEADNKMCVGTLQGGQCGAVGDGLHRLHFLLPNIKEGVETFASPCYPPGGKRTKAMYWDTGRVNCMGNDVGDARVVRWRCGGDGEEGP